MQWADVFGITVAFVAVIVTVLTVILGFLFTNNYRTHTREMLEVRGEYAKIIEELQKARTADAGSLREVLLAVKAMFDFLMVHSRQDDLSKTKSDLLEKNQWKGRGISSEEVRTYSERLDTELTRIHSELAARRTELYWLVGDPYEWAAHLHALVETHGDLQTIVLLENLRAIGHSSRDSDELLVAISRLRQRLGKTTSRKIKSIAWTGR